MFKVGDPVIWASAVGPVAAEYRGRSYVADGPEACIIVRPAGAPPYQIIVPLSKLSPAE